jgi:hypothetical protein
MNSIIRPRGMTAFTILWLGQVISLTGTAMSAFALMIWAWKLTGLATALALVSGFTLIPSVLVSLTCYVIPSLRNMEYLLPDHTGSIGFTLGI